MEYSRGGMLFFVLGEYPVATVPKANLLPISAEVNAQGHLVLGGCDALDLVQEFGSPLYVYDEPTLRLQGLR